MASTISAARANLYALLAGHAWPGTPPQVTFGPPNASERKEVVALLGVESGDEEWALLGGNRPRQEQFVLVVAVKVHDPAGTAATVDARFWALMDEVREVVYANQTLTNALTTGWARVAGQTTEGVEPALTEGGATAGWVQVGSVRIACRSRIA